MSRHQVLANPWHRFRLVCSCSLLVLCGSNISLQAEDPAEKKWSQPVERMPVNGRELTAGTDSKFPAENAPWIWGPSYDSSYVLKKSWVVPEGLVAAQLVATCDNEMELFLNGKSIGSSNEWQTPITIPLTGKLAKGENVLTAKVSNEGGIAAFACRLSMKDARGKVSTIESDESWQAFSSDDLQKQHPIKLVAKPGEGPWGQVMTNANEVSPAAKSFSVPSGFEVERLFVVPRDELGSWVAITSDPKGRLIASDQGGKGLVRITPAPLDGTGETIVEKIPVELSGAQGLLWAFDALYVVCNGGPGSGLYRATDSNGDDVLDKVEKLRDLQGGGEHGPHSIVLSPDGQKLFVICGNHTKVPFNVKDLTPPQTMGGIRTEQRRVELAGDGASRLPANWDEDQIITRMWDANGHAAGILAPGGYVVSTDKDGKSWEVWSAGYRNPYDMAFNTDGELFVYDADMEWDFGTPWYRPTRVNHATSGSELGWRSGSAKWPAIFPDSLPALYDIGPGSPVGVTFGYGTRFPAKYQQALYLCDWTFGTMYAIHLTPEGSSYRATREEFVSRTPLPLTDVTIGRDGAMYFTVGGRGGQGELYRVRYTGNESTQPVMAKSEEGAALRSLKRELESFHTSAANPDQAIPKALANLGHDDRYIRYAARVALEHQPVAQWKEKALASKSSLALIEGAIALAHQTDPSDQPAILKALDQIDIEKLSATQKVWLLRAYELAMIRLGEPSAEFKKSFAARWNPQFPSGEFDLDRQLSSMLVAVRAPGIVTKLVSLLSEQSSSRGRPTNLAPDENALKELITRNAGYGSAVRASLERGGDLLQIHYAYALRTIHDRDAWTIDDRKGYHGWFQRAREWAGGNSFRKFLVNMENESLTGLSENEKLALEVLGARKPYTPPPLPKPMGPGKAWTQDEVMALVTSGRLDRGRNFEKGKRTFAAARCIVCHRFGEDGGATGPDMTQVAGRFQIKDLVEAIVEPSKVVSDQYKASVVETADGRSLVGRIVHESPTSILLVTDPEDATKFVELQRKDIESIAPAQESLMPKGLLSTLNEEELLDLLAYSISRNNPRDARFKK